MSESYNPLGIGVPISDPSSQPKFGWWRHKKTDHLYEVLGFGLQEDALCPIVIYRSVQNGMIWTRPCAEFFDGRFKKEEG